MNAQGTDNDVAIITCYQAGDSTMFNPPINTLDNYYRMVQKRYGDIATEFEKL